MAEGDPTPTPTPTPVAPATPTPASATPAAAPAPAATPATPATPAAPTPAPAATLEPKSTPTDAKWPTDWREQWAGEDKGFLAQLRRYGSPKDAAEWIRKTSLRITAGELKEVKEPPKDATDEQMSAWRKEQGLPETPDAYVTGLKLPEGMVMGENDQPLLKSFAETAARAGLSQEAFNAQVEWWNETQQQILAERTEMDEDFRVEAEQTLVRDMGADFKPNMNVLKAFWQNAPEGMQDTLLTARTADGRIVGNIPEVVNFIVGLGRELHPTATLLPTGIESTPQAIATRKAEIEGMMYVKGQRNPAYWRNEALQQEYRDLISAEQRMNERAA